MARPKSDKVRAGFRLSAQVVDRLNAAVPPRERARFVESALVAALDRGEKPDVIEGPPAGTVNGNGSVRESRGTLVEGAVDEALLRAADPQTAYLSATPLERRVLQRVILRKDRDRARRAGGVPGPRFQGPEGLGARPRGSWAADGHFLSGRVSTFVQSRPSHAITAPSAEPAQIPTF
jgi:hypothetical protein